MARMSPECFPIMDSHNDQLEVLSNQDGILIYKIPAESRSAAQLINRIPPGLEDIVHVCLTGNQTNVTLEAQQVLTLLENHGIDHRQVFLQVHRRELDENGQLLHDFSMPDLALMDAIIQEYSGQRGENTPLQEAQNAA